MPSHHLLRRDSWPPTVVHLTAAAADLAAADLAADMDENPFSYFLESPTHDFDDLDIDLSAGIETDNLPHNPVREVSPSCLQRLPDPDHHPDPHLDRDELARLELAMHAWLAAPLSLRDLSRLHHHKARGKAARSGSGSGSGSYSPAADPGRGRGIVRLAPRVRERGSLAALQRPHSWREPSPDIGSIAEEEDEQEDVGMEEVPVLSDATPEPEEDRLPVRRKGKGGKRVRWAALPVEK